jgi:TetR/AcrR family transcriptional regulator, ethionamide resistance regulator
VATSTNPSEPTTRDGVVARLKAALERTIADGSRYVDIDVEDLARSAGLSRSSFYVYFQDKVDLIRELADEVIVGVIDIGRAWWDGTPPGNREELRAVLEDMMLAYRAQAPLAGVLVEAAAYDERVRAEYLSLVDRTRGAIEAHIRAGQRARVVRADVNPATAATWISWMLSRGSHELLRPATPVQFTKRLQALTDILWRTLYEHPDHG